MSRRAKADPQKDCLICGMPLRRKRFGSRLEDRTRFLTRVTCGQSCGNSRGAFVGLGGYRKRAATFRGAACEACGATSDLHAHHIDGDLTHNVAENIQTLCASCHQTHHWRSRRRGEPHAGPWAPPIPNNTKGDR